MIYTSLKFKVIVMLKYLVVFTLIIMFIFTFNFSKPAEIEAFALSSTVIIGILVALAGCGLYVLNFNSANAIAADVWNKMTDVLKTDLFNSVDESTRELTLSNDVFDYLRQYITDYYVVGNNFHSVDSMRVMSPWDIDYMYTPVDYDLGVVHKTITEEFYNNATKYEAITWGGKTMDYRYENWTKSYLYVNGVIYTTQEHDDYRFLNVNYYDDNRAENIYWDYSKRYISRFADSEPKFAFLYNALSGNMAPVIIYHYDGSSYYMDAFRLTGGYPYSNIITDNVSTINSDVEAVVDGTIVLDPDYDIVDRTMPLPYELGQIIGQTAGEVIAEQWADVMTIDRYIELYGSIPVSLSGEFEIPDSGTFVWTSLSLPMVELTGKFPFSIPFDLSSAIGNLVAEPVAPDFDIGLPDNDWFGGAQNMDLDFSIFNDLATVFRWIVLTGFVIGLILVTRKLIRG